MSDHQPAEEASIRWIDVGCRGVRKSLAIATLAAMGFCWMGLASSSRTPYTCAVCRMDREDRGCLGLKWSRQEETDCSHWYAENVEPIHAHSWVARTHCRSFGIPGLYRGFACSIGAPITMLSRSTQIEIYQHFRDPLEARRLFVRLGRTDADTQRTIASLNEWAGEGYPGSWDEWWEKHRAASK